MLLSPSFATLWKVLALKGKKGKTATKDPQKSELRPRTPSSRIPSLSTICDSTKADERSILRYRRTHSAGWAATFDRHASLWTLLLVLAADFKTTSWSYVLGLELEFQHLKISWDGNSPYANLIAILFRSWSQSWKNFRCSKTSRCSQCLLMALSPYQYVEVDNFLHLRRRLIVSQFCSRALCVEYQHLEPVWREASSEADLGPFSASRGLWKKRGVRQRPIAAFCDVWLS